jgi:hypothetical protein
MVKAENMSLNPSLKVHEITVIGAGSAGVMSVIRAAQLGNV